MTRHAPIPMIENGVSYTIKDGRLRELQGKNERMALGAGPKGLGCACAYCYPANVTAWLFRDGRPCCLPHMESAETPRCIVPKHAKWWAA